MKTDPQLVADWIALQYAPEDAYESNPLLAAFDVLSQMVSDRPDEAFEHILAILAADGSNTILETLSAGPLEDLLREHGPRMIARVEEAAADPRFARLLGGVWLTRMDSDVRSRVEAARDRTGWDGEN